MTIKEELEILRGEPIQVYTGDPMDIPCIETSDAKKLCQHPVVSVHMITYNHEPYIRQAIDGVMMQKTDFEFELVIGEDCSTDKTREICFEYQKRYPDKIRVLWCDHNLYRNPHPAGCNGERTTAHCRGEFIAFCEGDDYWIDPLKLQKQVDVMRKYPNVGLCFCGAKDKKELTGEFSEWVAYFPQSRVMAGMEYIRTRFHLDGASSIRPFADIQLRTLTAMVRSSILEKAKSKYEIMKWSLCVGDYKTWATIASMADLYFLNDVVGVYRIHPTGITSCNFKAVIRDCDVIRCFFLHRVCGYGVQNALVVLSGLFLTSVLTKSFIQRIRIGNMVWRNSDFGGILKYRYNKLCVVSMRFGLYCTYTKRLLDTISRLLNRRASAV